MPARAVVSQFFVTEAENEYVIRANSAIMKCKIPSFVSEFVQVDQWVADDGTIYTPGEEYVVQQFYETRVIDEFVLRGNTATLKCLVPSFVADFVDVIEWLAVEDGSTYTTSNQDEKVVGQYFEVQVYDQFAIRGNAAIFKCQVPSFVADHVDVVGWIDSNGGSYVADDQSYVVGQRYAVNVMDEHVLRGNAAIIKCHIPSFVAEFVEVDSWIEDNTTDIYPSPDYDGKYLVLPSGELHIRDVGPEDGYKTYQCRTKHRLTGETRLSATKGRLVITEPVGSVRPKFPSMDNINGLSTSSSDNIPLLCPAQGFPVPSYSPWEAYVQRFLLQMTSVASEHWSTVRKPCCAQHRGSPFLCTEPVGSVRPKFPTIDDSRSFRTTMDGSVTLLCPAQGFPVPLYKTGWQCKAEVSGYVEHKRFHDVPRWKYDAIDFLFHLIEPVGSVRPKFPTIDDTRGFRTIKDGSVTLACSAQGFPVPVHNARPKLSSTINLIGLSAKTNDSLSLFCPAQGFPVPTYRTGNQCKAKVHKCRYKGGQANSEHEQGVDDLSSSRVPCPYYTVSNNRYFSKDLPTFYSRLEPTSSAKPKLPANRKVEFVEMKLDGAVSLVCPLQGYPPVGFKPPIFSSDLTSSAYSRREGIGVVLACNAQGFPVPANIYLLFEDPKRSSISEPVGARSPRLTSDDLSRTIGRYEGQPITIFCAAQGSPVPTTRFFLGMIRIRFDRANKTFLFSLEIFNQLEAKHQPFPEKPRSLCYLDESEQKLASPATLRVTLSLRLGMKRTSHISVPNHCIQVIEFRCCLEPVGSKAPAFAGDTKLSLLIRRVNLDIGLLCNVQGHPPPKASTIGVPCPSRRRRERKNESRADFEEILSIFSFSFPEPMGSKAPAFLGDVKSFFFLRKENTEVSLLCNAQGHPVPVTRSLLYRYSGKFLEYRSSSPRFSTEIIF
ncbi:Down syndrome cell adhesion molecule-like protein Dscam2 [Vespula maculifrons]|uniref:Down syndrome cell adhesion molecule-like protein Dscam2 n=1 Tax=Vespula maculifrons TaxID=7453 RepID=A0ABD2C8D7_VESMC